MKLRSALLTATLLATPVAAMAQPVDGLYVGAGLGYGVTTDTKVKHYSERNSTFPGSKLSGDGGFAGVGSVGYGLGNGFRFEVQGDYLNQVDHYNGGLRTGKAQLQKYGAFVNALFDFDIGQDFVFPYVGVGVGYQFTSPHHFDLDRSPAPNSYHFDDTSEGSIAGQAIVGAAFPLPGVPGLSLTAEYRFIYEGSDEKFKGSYTNTAGTVPAGAKLDNAMSHVGLIGLRYAFNVPTPPPPPGPVVAAPPTAQPARTYLVFFDWDKADLTARARQIISEAATNATAVKVSTINVSGNADRSGTPAYNQKLSLRRADNVAAELVRLGIPKSEIVIMAFGDTRPLVPTAAGVREPQNRRVEIVLK